MPLNSNEDAAIIREREHALNKLIDDIKALVPQTEAKEYDTLIGNATESALRRMKLNFPIDFEKEFVVKKDLHYNILARIQDTNEKVLGIMPTTNRRKLNSRKGSPKWRESMMKSKMKMKKERRENGGRKSLIVNHGDIRNKVRKETNRPRSVNNKQKTESVITLGKDRKRTESMRTIVDRSTSASMNDDCDDFGTLLPKNKVKHVQKYIDDDVFLEYTENSEDSSATSRVPEKNEMPHMDNAYLNTGQYGSVNENDVIHKQNEAFTVDNTTNSTDKKNDHICYCGSSPHKVSSQNTARAARTIGCIGRNKKTAELCSQETCQGSRNLYLRKDSVKCTLSSKKPCVSTKDLQQLTKCEKSCADFKREMGYEIVNWISSTNIFKYDAHIRRQDIVGTVVDYIAKYLDKPNDKIDYSVIKAKLYAIFKDLGIEVNTDKLHVLVDNISDKLGNKVINIKKRTECSNIKASNRPIKKHIPNIEYVAVKHSIIDKDQLKNNLMPKIMKCLEKTNTNNNVLNKIAQVLINNIDSADTRDCKDAMYDISGILEVTGKSEDDRKQLSEIIIENTKHILAMACINAENNVLNTSSSFVTSSSYNYFCRPCPCTPLEKEVPIVGVNTSKSKTKKTKRNIHAVGTNERAYMDKIAVVVENWFHKFGNLKQEENKELKDVMLYDLAGRIVAHEKWNQLAPDPSINQDQFMRYHIYEWLKEFELFNYVHESETVINELSKQLRTIDIPDFINPRLSLIQSMTNVKHRSLGEFDILEDYIHNWFNEQDSKVFYNSASLDKNKENLIHELVTQIQSLLDNPNKNNIKTETDNGVQIFIELKQKAGMAAMSEELIGKVTKLRSAKPTKLQKRLEKIIRKKIEDIIQKKLEMSKGIQIRLVTQNELTRRNSIQAQETTQDGHVDFKIDIETTMKEYILKYIQQNYDVDDAMTRGAYAQLLKDELQKLGATIGKEENKVDYEKFSPQKLDKELQYVIYISDWLKNLPIDGSYNVVNNKNRIDFINYLAKNIVALEDEREKKPDAVDYNFYLRIIITQFTEQLPLLPGTDNVTYLVEHLLKKINVKRNQTPYYSQLNEPKLTEFIDQYVRVNGKEVADDELKLEAWSARLLKEIQKIVNEPDANVLNKSKTYRKLSIPSTSDQEPVKRFQQELEIAKEIIDWLKNLLLLESKSDIIVLLASDFSQKVAAAEANKSDSQVKEELDDYLDYWFKQLPLDDKQEIDKVMAVEQLMNRVRKVTTCKYQKVNKRNKLLSFAPASSTQLIENEGNEQKIKSMKFLKDKSHPGQNLVKTIDNWCINLNFDGGNPETRKITKDKIATELYQKIHALNNEPRIHADNNLFTREMGFEIDKILQNLPEQLKLNGDQNDLRQCLLLKVKNAREEIVDILAGANYRDALDVTLDNCLPNPMHAEKDPEFDMYKEKLTDNFILENFDYSITDPNKKYANHIKNKINQFSQSALKRNAVPLSKEYIYNELYSSMYKVPIPNENIIADKVEEIKTRCEIDSWFDKLPIKPPQDMKELKCWDQILNTLTKRIHYIEKVKTNSDEKMHKEITKLLIHFPLLQENVDDIANRLVSKLKASEKYRKCVKSDDYIEEPLIVKMYPTVPLSDDQLMQIQKNDCRKRGVDVITDVVETWSSKVPVTASSFEKQNSIRDGIATDILKKLCELYSDSEIFNGDIVYDYLLNKELDKIVNKLLQNNAKKNIEKRKQELIQAVKLATNILKEERIKQYYIDDLRLTVTRILPMQQNDNSEHDLMYDHTMDKIVSNFMEYAYNREDEGAKQFYKSKIFRDIRKYIMDIKDQADPLLITNVIVCDMTKLPIPKDYIIKEQIDEIRMRHAVKDFINDILPRNESDQLSFTTNQHINCLAKILYTIEKCGHNEANASKMRKAIYKGLNKLKSDLIIDDKKITCFIERLRESEPFRKAFPIRKAEHLSKGSRPAGVQPSEDQYVDSGYSVMRVEKPVQPHQKLKIPEQNTIDYSDFNTGCQDISSQIQPNSGGGWQNKYTCKDEKYPSGSFLTTGGQNKNSNHIVQMNQTVEYPSFNRGFPATFTPQPELQVSSNWPVTGGTPDPLVPSHPKNETVEPWYSSDSGAEIHLQEVSVMLHGPLLIENPAEGLVQPWTSTVSGAQFQTENMSAKIHNPPGTYTSLQPFKPPPQMELTNTPTQPGVRIPSPVFTIDNQPVSVIPNEAVSTFTPVQVLPTVSSCCHRNQELEHSPYNQKFLPDIKEASLPSRLSRREFTKEPFEDFGTHEQRNSPELILNAQNLISPAVHFPIPINLAVPGPAYTPNPIERFSGARLVSTSTAGPVYTPNVVNESTGAKVWVPDSIAKNPSEFTPLEQNYGQQGTASSLTLYTSTECIPCTKYFQKRRSPNHYACSRPPTNITPCCPCSFLEDMC